MLQNLTYPYQQTYTYSGSDSTSTYINPYTDTLPIYTNSYIFIIKNDTFKTCTIWFWFKNYLNIIYTIPTSLFTEKILKEALKVCIGASKKGDFNYKIYKIYTACLNTDNERAVIHNFLTLPDKSFNLIFQGHKVFLLKDLVKVTKQIYVRLFTDAI